MKSYNNYSASGIDWLDKIPAGWKLSKIKYELKFQTGFTPPTGNSEYYEGQNNWITIADLKQKFVCNSETKISDKAITDCNASITPENSLLYSFKLSVGKTAFANCNLYTNEAIASFLPTEKNCLRFFYYSLPNQLLKNANENIYGAKLLNQDLIKNALILCPPIDEQILIANYLDTKTTEINTAITQKHQLIKLLNEEKQALINEGVTKGINPHVPLKETGIRWLAKIPEHWEVRKLKFIVNKIDQVVLDTDFLVAVENIESKTGKLVEMDVEKSYQGAISEFKKGDVIFNKLRPYLTKVYHAEKNGGCFGELLILRTTEEIHSSFLFFRLLSHSFIAEVNSSTEGTKMPRANWEDFIKHIEIGVPSFDEQSRIVNYLKQSIAEIDFTISKIEKEIALLEEYKASLIYEAVTGKINVSNYDLANSNHWE